LRTLNLLIVGDIRIIIDPLRCVRLPGSNQSRDTPVTLGVPLLTCTLTIRLSVASLGMLKRAKNSCALRGQTVSSQQRNQHSRSSPPNRF
jgi:hypothetical protein